MSALFRRTYTDKQTGESRTARKWYGQYTDADGKRQRVPLSTNKGAAQQMLNEIVRRVEMERAGIRDRFAEHRRRPLGEHLKDWTASLKASGRGEDYIALKLARVRAIIAGCKFVFLADLSADRLELFLADLRVKEGR